MSAPRDTDLAAPVLRYLRSARTRHSMARALGGGTEPPDAYLSMATTILAALQDDYAARPDSAPRETAAAPALDVELLMEALEGVFPWTGWVRRDVKAVAAEYARLAAAGEPE